MSLDRRTALLLAVVPGAALANSGVGFFMVPLPVILLALIPTIVIESVVLALMLKIGWKRAGILSLWANVVSTLVGFVGGLAFDFLVMGTSGTSGIPLTRVSAAVMLVPWFFFSWWIEYRAIAKRTSELSMPAVRNAIGAANALTYALMFACALFSPLLPTHDLDWLRVQIYRAVGGVDALRGEVGAHWAQHGQFPQGGKGLQDPNGAYRARLGTDGRIEIEFSLPGVGELNGRHIVLAPAADAAKPRGELSWQCTSPDIERRYLPRDCSPPKP